MFGFGKKVRAEDKYFQKGVEFADQQEFQKAIPYFKKVLEINNKSFEGYVNLGACIENSGDPKKALEIYQMVLDRNLFPYKSGDHFIYSIIARTYTLLKQFDKAVQAAEKSIKSDPIKTEGYITLARVYNEKGDNSLANRYWIYAAKLGHTGVQNYLDKENIKWGTPSKLPFSLPPRILYDMNADQLSYVAGLLGVKDIFDNKHKQQIEQRVEEHIVKITTPNKLYEQNKFQENKIRETELKGMSTVMDYEKGKLRKPQDVSSQNLGYDILSSKSGVDRFIEVKAKSNEGDILITKNEWETANKFGFNYYLYVVLNCDSYSPNLYVIPNPRSKLNVRFDAIKNKYVLPISEIKQWENVFN